MTDCKADHVWKTINIQNRRGYTKCDIIIFCVDVQIDLQLWWCSSTKAFFRIMRWLRLWGYRKAFIPGTYWLSLVQAKLQIFALCCVSDKRQQQMFCWRRLRAYYILFKPAVNTNRPLCVLETQEFVRSLNTMERESSRSQLAERNLRRNALRYNLKITGHTPSDGNCMFHALAASINNLDLQHFPQQDIRKRVVEWLREPVLGKWCISTRLCAQHGLGHVLRWAGKRIMEETTFH